MPLSTNYQKLKALTLNYNSLTTEHISKINDIVKSVIDKKTDEYKQKQLKEDEPY